MTGASNIGQRFAAASWLLLPMAVLLPCLASASPGFPAVITIAVPRGNTVQLSQLSCSQLDSIMEPLIPTQPGAAPAGPPTCDLFYPSSSRPIQTELTYTVRTG